MGDEGNLESVHERVCEVKSSEGKNARCVTAVGQSDTVLVLVLAGPGLGLGLGTRTAMQPAALEVEVEVEERLGWTGSTALARLVFRWQERRDETRGEQRGGEKPQGFCLTRKHSLTHSQVALTLLKTAWRRYTFEESGPRAVHVHMHCLALPCPALDTAKRWDE